MKAWNPGLQRWWETRRSGLGVVVNICSQDSRRPPDRDKNRRESGQVWTLGHTAFILAVSCSNVVWPLPCFPT